ncbi:MAG TPA: protein kinase [Verrucomicrobiae bacterium]|nr:protein kinase [Verrucomicrobiae bacterium]
MELIYGELSSAGTVRPKNEDCVGFWEPDSLDEKRARGAIAVLADGVGGQGRGDVASRLAVEECIKTFRETKSELSPQQLLTQAFNAANLAVFNKNTESPSDKRMATTLAVVIFRNDHVTVGNVGDTRVYLTRKAEIKQISTDHSYVAMQRKFGLISEQDAKKSENRFILTRSVGQEPVIRVDIEDIAVQPGDRIVLCSDGLHGVLADGEICEIVGRFAPAAACRQLVALAEQRGTDDNVSAQVIQIEEIEAVGYYRGVPMFHKPAEKEATGEVEAGQLLDDRFFIHEVISRSGMATIFRATDRQTKQMVAIKVPYLQFESDPGFFSRFVREEEIGLKLQHPSILKFIPVEKKSRPYIVTEYLRGYTLSHLLNSIRPMPVTDALKLSSRICDALEYLHGLGITHRDLKPQNIMMCYDGTIRLMDFGIARGGEGRRITYTGFTPALGTPDYMAPEQVKGKRGDARTDIYSLGAMLYEMVTGQTPFEGETPLIVMNARLVGDPVAPRKLQPTIPPQIEEIVLHAMERDPANRYRSAAEMKTEIDDPDSVTVTGRAERLQAVTPWKHGWGKVRKVALTVLLPLLALTILFLLLVLWHPAHHH